MRWLCSALLALMLVGCGGGGEDQPEAKILQQQVVDAQAQVGRWKLVAVGALLLGLLIGCALGARDDP